MNPNELQQLFPEAKITAAPSLGPDYFTLPYKKQWVHIPEHTLSGREKVLLKNLLSRDATPSEIPNNPWARFLLGHSSEIPPGLAQTQLLQFSLSYREEEAGSFDQTLWLDAFSQTLPLVRECFFLDDKNGLFILDSPEPYCIDEELAAVLDILDDDFSLRTALYLGQRWPVDSGLPLLFEEERKIFAVSRTIAKGNKITTLAAIALPYFLSGSGSKSLVLLALQTTIGSVDGTHELIAAMWRNQGNLSKAAADLYLHRNTLQYRIDRFFDATGLALKNMDDLALAYLAVTATTESHST
ncbi:PucR-like helix-turn-helix protein [Trichococcus patagoniensis]|uniref:PucR-like helix-turn-helix protein n=1 Tax=Trichococcus patagoniensis TaxID=382641 RepID=A0A2T5ICA5_9LACT|nr:helix-turn-helix domain-containing protein [Trichococcus patagoniensis]PTQ81444.1 PucR-like helix-turn-helix protein [Trichococcus patagoniensis]